MKLRYSDISSTGIIDNVSVIYSIHYCYETYLLLTRERFIHPRIGFTFRIIDEDRGGPDKDYLGGFTVTVLYNIVCIPNTTQLNELYSGRNPMLCVTKWYRVTLDISNVDIFNLDSVEIGFENLSQEDKDMSISFSLDRSRPDSFNTLCLLNRSNPVFSYGYDDTLYHNFIQLTRRAEDSRIYLNIIVTGKFTYDIYQTGDDYSLVSVRIGILSCGDYLLNQLVDVCNLTNRN
jgi:hypothetical protein